MFIYMYIYKCLYIRIYISIAKILVPKFSKFS